MQSINKQYYVKRTNRMSYSSISHQTKSLTYRRVIAKQGGNVIVVSTDEFYQPYFDEYVKICDIPTFITNITPSECMKTLIFPDTPDQIEIMKIVEDMESMVPIREIKPYIMHYLSNGDMDSANAILKIYQSYLHDMQLLRDMIMAIFL